MGKPRNRQASKRPQASLLTPKDRKQACWLQTWSEVVQKSCLSYRAKRDILTPKGKTPTLLGVTTVL